MAKDREKYKMGVAREMKRLSEERYPGVTQYHESMYLLGLLHDIGYEFTENPKDHARVGGRVLEDQGFRYWLEVKNQGRFNTEYTSEELDILNTALLSIDVYGARVPVEIRIDHIGYRHGYESTKYKESKKIAESLGLV